MVVGELLLDGAVKTLDVRIHLWSSWIGMIVLNLESQQSFREVFLEL